ncbi:circular bacteriocin, circularin A/uberolysin family [Pelagirhabdus alkalitolerans]|uniref:Circular bacteriocin, circularin A/uberolysin family n=1 Tax=Pelagirhabdus alkalitolerans TaxID=1612202 RepID=A0A1G6M5N3_9BACI|nr:hypothetical protein [Pelagirhabdus alkalitolerans]SDC50296.1 circular bacteriocin, circularin A/uberolysin family [Pelagirhabdus alkalitolerans]
MSHELKKEAVLLFSFTLILSATIPALPTFFAAVNLGISQGLATNVYYALQWVSWGATAAAIISSFGLGALGAQAIWAAVKKWSLNKFVTW